MTAQLPGPGNVLVALGANCPGPWGTPRETLERALAALEQEGIAVTARSPFYETAAIGQTRQHPYLNAVARVATTKPPAALLRVLKQIERRAGRRGGGRPWGSRTLDLDIVDYKGLVQNWRFKRHCSAARRPSPARPAPSADPGPALRAPAAARCRTGLAPPGAGLKRARPVAACGEQGGRPRVAAAVIRPQAGN